MEKGVGRQLPHDVLEHYRMQAIKLRKKGWKVNKIAEAFGLNRRAITRWFEMYHEGGIKALKSKKAKGPDYKLSEKEIKRVLSVLKDDATIYGFETPLWTCKRVQQFILKEIRKKMHTTGIMKLFKKFRLSPQKPTKTSPQRDRKAVRRWLREEWPKIKEHRRKWQAMLYFLDEAGVSLTPVLGRTWAPKGKTPIVMVTGNRGGLIVTSAVSPAGKLIFRIEKERVKTKQHIEFLKKMLKQHPNRKIIVIEDRAPPHRAKKVDGFVEENKKRLALYRLPPYAPDLNPDEHVWEYLKAYQLKTHQAQTTQELKHLVKRKMHSIQKNKSLLLSIFAGTYVL